MKLDLNKSNHIVGRCFYTLNDDCPTARYFKIAMEVNTPTAIIIIPEGDFESNAKIAEFLHTLAMEFEALAENRV